MSEETGALDGLRVLDLATGSFGYTGKLLAGLGADVLKVEPPEGDPVRRHPPFAGDERDPELAARHLHLGTGKRSIVIDLEREEGRDLLRRLVAQTDVLIESFEPGYLDGRGLGYDDLARERPDLVMASITHYGQDGPYAGYAGEEIVATALGGYLKLTGDPDREPVKPYDELVLHQAALHAAVAIMTGITHRDATGEGDHFDVAAIDAALFLLGGLAQGYQADGLVPVRAGARLLFSSPRYPYPSTVRPCRDGHVHAHSNNRHIDLLAVLMEDPRIDELMDTPMANADGIDVLMDEWLAQYDREEIVRRAQELRLPFTAVQDPVEVLADPHLAERGFFVEVEHPRAGAVRQPGAPMEMTATPWRTGRAPLLGEHGDELLTEVLGMPAEEIAELRAGEVLG
jgi:crotonobetainyl-CoA:carnitine CoA-transferase CaiB-like acyl-CoA transferase